MRTATAAVVGLVAAWAGLAWAGEPPATRPAGATAAAIEARAEGILQKMTLEEKIDYIGGERDFFIRPLARLGLPAIKMSDGPQGVRCYGPSTGYPAGICMAATWDTALIEREGRAMGDDCRARGVHILLGPGPNIYRVPVNGRNFEYYGEDPYLAAGGGLDLEMPNAAHMNRGQLIPAVREGRLKEAVLDEKVRRILRKVIEMGFLDRPQEDKSIPADNPASVKVALEAASEAEGGDRSYALPAEQVELIRAVAAVNRRTIVVLNSGGGVDWQGWLDRVPAVLHAWYPGQEEGTAVAEILFGAVNPSGKLPASFEKRPEDGPCYASYHASKEDRMAYSEGVFVGYRGFDRNGVEPRFGFGHGLSYTTFAYDDLQVRTEGRGDSRRVVVTARVTNKGPRAGREVAQLYVGDVAASVPRPPRELKGFASVELAPGEARTVRFELDRRAFAFYDVAGKGWKVEPGEFVIQVGRSSRDLPLKATLTW